jgi:SAM-dependent methyltransferase
MPKKILFESAVHQFASAGARLQSLWRDESPAKAQRLALWLRDLQVANLGAGQLRIEWSVPSAGAHVIEFKPAKFYTRGDTPVHATLQRENSLEFAASDRVMTANRAFFDESLRATLLAAALFDDDGSNEPVPVPSSVASGTDEKRKAAEESFHDDWAASEDLAAIDVRRRNEACTAPEMRHVRAALGDLRGRTLLDVGCGLGEASVYFALAGAKVTATDLSPGMCDATRRLAELQGTHVETHVSAAEDLRLGDRQFDVIYTGNTLHHVDIAATLDRMLPHLRDGGTFVSWDPVAYNPVINVYRRIATQVRTPDEHPLRLRDIRAIRARFGTSETRWFWLSTLLIFVCMACVQFRNPNRTRFWKTVIDEADTWRWLYRPLEKLDRWLLAACPPLRPLCWNVVIVARNPLRSPPAAHG